MRVTTTQIFLPFISLVTFVKRHLRVVLGFERKFQVEILPDVGHFVMGSWNLVSRFLTHFRAKLIQANTGFTGNMIFYEVKEFYKLKKQTKIEKLKYVDFRNKRLREDCVN